MNNSKNWNFNNNKPWKGSMNTYFFDSGDLNGALSNSLDLLDGEENSVDGDVNVLLATGVL